MSNIKNLPRNAILSGASALAWLNMISYTPEKITITLPRGSENKNYYYQRGFKVSGANKELYEYKVKIINGIKVYTPERLFIDLYKTPLENTIKTEAIKNLKKYLNPHEVKRIYDKVKKIYRGVDFQYVIDYLAKFFAPINEKIISSPHLAGDLIREFALFLIGEFEIPVLLKGGSAIELFLNNKRATEDIDLIIGNETVAAILKKLSDSRNDIYFKIDEKEKNSKTFKNITKFNLLIKSKSEKVRNIIKEAKLKIGFNCSFSEKEIKTMIKTYKLSKKPLKYFSQKSCYTFSLEMLIAEKYQAIITKPENTKRTKDLIDLYMLKVAKPQYNIKKIWKWYLRKNETQRTPYNQTKSFEIIKSNKDLKLTLIKENWSDSIEMYNLKIQFQDALKIYQQFSSELLILATQEMRKEK